MTPRILAAALAICLCAASALADGSPSASPPRVKVMTDVYAIIDDDGVATFDTGPEVFLKDGSYLKYDPDDKRFHIHEPPRPTRVTPGQFSFSAKNLMFHKVIIEPARISVKSTDTAYVNVTDEFTFYIDISKLSDGDRGSLIDHCSDRVLSSADACTMSISGLVWGGSNESVFILFPKLSPLPAH